MNKFLLLVCCIATLSMFSCSKDDDDNSWQELPQGEIVAGDVSLQLNGQNTTGTVSFSALSLESAEVGLKDVIDGYSDVTIGVKMEKQTDGSFTLSGSKDITAKPARTRSDAFLTVSADGNITPDGKLSLNLSASGPGLYIGTYSAETLTLSYGGNLLTGKTVVFDATDGNNVSLLLKDVIPGESETLLTGVSLNEDGFTGTATTANATVEYSGNREDKVLTLNLDVTMNNPGGWVGTYGLGSYSVEEIDAFGRNFSFVTESSLYVDWQGLEGDNALLYASLLRGFGGMLLPQVLKDVTFEKDGNITARYSSNAIPMDPDGILDMFSGIVPSADDVSALIPFEGWLQSPKNLAYWYKKGGQLYLKLNIPGIIETTMGADAGALSDVISTILQSEPSVIKELLNTMLRVDFSGVTDEAFAALLTWAKEGVPMDVKSTDGHTYVYLNKEALSPLLKSYKTGIVNEWGEEETTTDIVRILIALQNAGIIPEEYAPGVLVVFVIGKYYNESTEFNLGLDLSK